jgi:hypothetical protein
MSGNRFSIKGDIMKRQLLISIMAVTSFIGLSTLRQAQARDGAHDAADNLLEGTWAINFIVPVSPKGNDFGQPHRHKFDFQDDNGQRTVIAHEIENLRVPGAWRISGDSFSAGFEFTCPEGVTCGTVTMRGRLDSAEKLSGRIVVIWDSPDDSTPTGYDTVTGTFTGERCGGVHTQHDTGGCESPN